MEDVLNQAGDLSGKGIATCSFPTNEDNTGLVRAHISSGAEALAQKAPRAEVVAAFNSVPREVLFSVFEARGIATRPSLVYCGATQTGKRLAASQ
jgi:8-hydroxy-5-deazaflavin:NADPH oxidoreductase